MLNGMKDATTDHNADTVDRDSAFGHLRKHGLLDGLLHGQSENAALFLTVRAVTFERMLRWFVN